jgi:hypothetical protein
MPRKKLKTNQRHSVLEEFSYLCAICGERRPHIHHIDGDNANNNSTNLLPLCPNHHLTDVHDPTRPIPPGQLRLLRQYRDPFVLHPRFGPIYERLSLYYKIPEFVEWEPVKDCSYDLRFFINQLPMGSYYAEAIQNVTRIMVENISARVNERADRFGLQPGFPHDAFTEALTRIEQLLVEMLRYQGWSRDELP